MTDSHITNFDPKKSKILLAFVTIFLLLPFLPKAYNIDDPLFLWTARQIQIDPFNFYGFSVNWNGLVQQMSSVTKNPPLVAYYLGFWTFFFGWNEIWVHLAFIIPATGLSLGVYSLSRKFCQRPSLAAFIVILTPAYLVSGTSIMADISMLCFYVWAIVFWLSGLENNRSSYLLLSSIFICLSSLTKYFGMSLLPLLFLYSLAIEKKPGKWVFFLLVPVLILTGYQWLTYKLYGQDLLTQAILYSNHYRLETETSVLVKTLTGLSFTGGCLVSAAFFMPVIWARRGLAYAFILIILVVTILIAIGSVGKLSFQSEGNVRWGIALQLAIFIVAGLHILHLAVLDLWKNKDALSLLLFLWVVGTFIFSSYINWTVNARSVLTMAPAVAILITRRMDKKVEMNPCKNGKSIPYIPLILAGCLSISTAWADFTLAECQRSAGGKIRSWFKDYPQTVWFQGHWGFQYYIEMNGGKALDFDGTSLKFGDIVIIPRNNTCTTKLPEAEYHLIEKHQEIPSRWLGIMASSLGAGFYSSVWGPLPFALGAVPPEEYHIFLAGRFKNPAAAVSALKRQWGISR